MNKKKNHLEKIWDNPNPPKKHATSKEKLEVELLQRKIQEKLKNDPDLAKKASLILNHWLNPKK